MFSYSDTVAESYLQHAKNLHNTAFPTEYYNIKCDLFSLYLELTDDKKLMVDQPRDHQIYFALLCAAIVGEI